MSVSPVLQRGGNAVDAAVAVGFAMAVTHPFAGNLGGGGFMLIRMADGRMTFIDFRERAPEKASRNMYLDAKGSSPATASRAGVPPASLARCGVRAGGVRSSDGGSGPTTWRPPWSWRRKDSLFPTRLRRASRGRRIWRSSPESKRIFQKNGAFYEVGESLAQPELAQTLERISKSGANEFYEGETAKRFAEEMAKHGGLITLQI